MKSPNLYTVINWTFGLLVMTIGLLNIVLVHIIPGLVYIFLALIYFPPMNNFLQKNMGFSIPAAIKIILAVVIIWFTLGISDLGEMFGL